MGSINSIWIPTLAVAHIFGILMWLYAVTRLAGPKRKHNGKKEKKGDQKEEPAVKDPSVYSNGHGNKAVELTTTMDKELDFGPATAVPVVSGRSPLPVELSWTGISYKVLQGKPGKGKKSHVKRILHPCTGRFRAGEAAALMGPSGAGKSTMMDILTGRKPSGGTGGTVRVNGHVLNPTIAGKYISYIGQEDVFLPNLTAWESLSFYSWLSIPSPLSKGERHACMNSVLETMGLQEVKHSMVGGLMPGGVLVRGLSGGEKRRLSVACGLVGNPSLVFLDEPTTGLDSHAALSMVRHMVSLTRLGHTIACSIHQPRQEIFNAFDKVVILSEGHQVYISPPGECCQWFNGGLGYTYRPEEDGTVADWVISLVSIRFRDEESAKASRFMNNREDVERAALAFTEHLEEQRLKDEGRDSILCSTMDEPDMHQVDSRSTMQSIMCSFQNLLTTNQRDVIAESAAIPEGDQPPRKKGQYPQSWLVQYYMLTRRALRTTLRNPSESSLRLVVACWIGMIAGLVYIRLPDNATSAQPRASTIFFLLMLNAVTPISYMAFYVSDRRFFKMDSANGLYAPSAYYMSTVTAGSPFVIMNTCAGALMAYGLAGLRNDTRAIFIWMSIISLHALVSNQFLVTCIWLTSTQDTAYAIGSTYLTFSLLFCGFYVAVHNMVLSVARGLSWASFSKYTFEALTRNEFQDRVWSESCSYTHTAVLIGGAEPLCTTQGDAILNYLGLNLTITQGALSLLGFYGLFHLTSFLALLRLHNKKDK